jgi:putative ABC transport system permease protein
METNSIIKDAGGHAAGGVRENRTRSALVTVEMGLAVVLLIGAALLIRTSVALGRVDPGFDASHVLALHSALAGPQYRTALAPTVSTGLERLRSLPGVGNAATTVFLPPGGALSMPFDIVGRPRDDTGRSTGSAYTNASSEGYFATLGIPVIRGRAFAARDDTGSPAVAVINETMAKRYWASGQDPLQDSILIGGSQASDGEPARRIVGIVGDAHYGGLDKDPEPMMYMPMAQLSEPEYTLWEQTGAPTAWVVRTLGDSAALSVTIKDTLAQATGLPVTNVVPMERSVSNSVSRHRLNMLLMSIFGGGAVLLAAIGIYGIMAYSVQQRVREIGIRMALGGDADRVKRAVVRQGMRLVVIGIAAGLVAAFYTANVLASWLFGVKSRDPIVFVAVPVVLALIALAAVWVPARRASRIDPLEALRYE